MWIKNKENGKVVEVSVETGASMITNGYAEPAEAPKQAENGTDQQPEAPDADNKPKVVRK